ncbi:MAG: mechanosensitive ion channel protein MscS [Parcubacteria group bacterium CG11_big_fil_rev_8_21_14_0_20_39_22]|nr:MAG: mechanosensitive ion channel protein MscS [Parcubacteria group bacterium CG11_big_fil_rev_8_21_14_0_20_39_22]
MIDSIFLHPVWEKVILENTVREYGVAVILFFIFYFVFRIFYSVAIQRLSIISQRTENDLDDLLISVVKSFKPRFYTFVAFFIAFKTIYVVDLVDKGITALLILWVIYQVSGIVQVIIDYAVGKRFTDSEEGEKDGQAKAAVDFLNLIVKGVLWVFGILMLLSNLGINITSLIAGLGIGGVAIAFALQNILGDLFSSFAIYFDKPFVVGDFIVVGDKMGVVKKIGIKTTRVQALQGEEIVFSNKELTSTSIQNFKQMQERRVQFSIGVTYDTSPDKIAKANNKIGEIVKEMEHIRFDRSHFKEFADSSLVIEIVYYIDTADYNKYMDIQQELNLSIMKFFKKEKIEFAFPTRTIFLQK